MPSTDPRFLDATVEEMLTDVWAHRFLKDPKLLEEIEDDDFDPSDIPDIKPMEPSPDVTDFEDLK